MLTPDEERFLQSWENEKKNRPRGWRQYRRGLTVGMIIGAGVLVSLSTGWYSRANMVANSQSTPLVLLLAVTIIAVFCAVFYRHFRNDMNEQRYKELMYKKEKEISPDMQQEAQESGQGR